MSIKVFYSYSHKDKELRNKLDKHLSTLKRHQVISSWYDRDISGGTEWAGEIDEHLNTAQVILLLISSDFLASDYCVKEMERAMERHEAGEARVIPVILRPCIWQGEPFGKLQAFPKNAKAVTSWENQDEAFCNIAEGIAKAIDELRAREEELQIERELGAKQESGNRNGACQVLDEERLRSWSRLATHSEISELLKAMKDVVFDIKPNRTYSEIYEPAIFTQFKELGGHRQIGLLEIVQQIVECFPENQK